MTCVVTGSSSYATGGDTISLATLGLSEVREAWIAAFDSQSVNGGVSAEVVVTTPTAPTLKLYSAAATEVVSTTNVSTRTYIIRFVGR